jgi:putative transposase
MSLESAGDGPVALCGIWESAREAPSPRTSTPRAGHAIYPYLLRNIAITGPNHVWSTDITFIPMACGFVYLTAVIDWHSRYVLSWRLSNTLDRGFCIEALESALSSGFKPEIFNTDQGSQYTSADFINVLKRHNIRISMDGRGRALDNAFIERLWRTVKYEEIYLNHYDSVWELEDRLTAWFDFYRNRRRHSALNYRCPAELFFGSAAVGKESLQRA